ncbi:Uncharacterized protein NEOC65_002037 [Neochlamydia sp. AcF65]|nr:Uncharacterized protein [Neochlamydia sp. AcF65]
MGYMKLLKSLKSEEALDSKQYEILEGFYLSFAQAVTENNKPMSAYEPIITQYLQFVIQENQQPYSFEPYHRAIRAPYDYYRLGLEMMRPLIVFAHSKIHHAQHIEEIETHLANQENVILLANHQIEPDPQVICLMLEKDHTRLAEEMIFVAGHRVITDPLAIPLSKGCNLLCIFSKKHIENPPEKKQAKLLYNQRVMHQMSQLLAEGGKCIYVAPSGGRDRANINTGQVEIAPFDAPSIEMFWLMAQHSGKKTHFYPLSLSTYDLLPPPQSVEKELGERRQAKCAPVHLSFGQEIDMINFPGSQHLDKKARRIARAQYIWELVMQQYYLARSYAPPHPSRTSS